MTTNGSVQPESQAGEEPPAYPDRWQTHTVLSDGATVEIRPIKPSDRDALVDFHRRQSTESIYFRFFSPRPGLSERELDFFTQVDYRTRMAFVAFEGGQLVAVARYEQGTAPSEEGPTDIEPSTISPIGPSAEVAFFVDDANHGRGLATVLLEYLAAAARANGYVSFTASVLPENYRMLGVFRAAGFATTTGFADGVIEVVIDLRQTAEAAATIARRLQLATSRSLQPLLAPDVVAIVGAGRRAGSLGHELLMSALGRKEDPPFPGLVLAVNPNADEVAGVPTHSSVTAAVTAIDRGVDLAVVAVPADQVPSVVEDCGRAGVRGVLIVTSGFDLPAPDGTDTQRELIAIARDHGMRVIGPSAFGLANTTWSTVDRPSVLNLLSVPITVLPGPVGLASDSGLLAAAVIDQFRLAGVGVSQVVGVGNQADVAIGDLVGYWALDEPTRVVVLYSNELQDERSGSRPVAEALRATSILKPVVAVSPADIDSARLLAESGVILVDAVGELADQALLQASQPIPAGRKVAIVSNSASLARLTATACRRHGLEPTVPLSATRWVRNESILIDDLDRISEVFGPTVAVSEAGSLDDCESVIVATAVHQDVDGLILALLPTDNMSLDDLGHLADRINRSVDKPIVVVGLYDRSAVGRLHPVDNLPFYTFPEEAARALSRSAAYGDWRRSTADMVWPVEDSAWLTDLLGEAPSKRFTMVDPETAHVADRLGIPLADYVVCSRLSEVEAAARGLGYPVVLRVAGGPVSIGESGGTAIDLHDRRSLRQAHARMSEHLGSSYDHVVVQRHVPHQLPARLDMTIDHELGPNLSLGFGGDAFGATEPVDRTFLPTSGARLVELIDRFRSSVGEGVVSEVAAADLAALVETVAGLASSHRELRTLILNPILIGPDGAVPASLELELAVVNGDPLDDVRHLN